MSHTPEPWKLGYSDGSGLGRHDDDNPTIVSAPNDDCVCSGACDSWNVLGGMSPADAARAIACVNALAGLNPEALAGLVAAARVIGTWGDAFDEFSPGIVTPDFLRDLADRLSDLRSALAALEAD